jgi:DNA-binding CsgD family transcriptional regulator
VSGSSVEKGGKRREKGGKRAENEGSSPQKKVCDGGVGGSGRVFVAAKRRGGRSIAAYRRVGRYHKSVARWQLERARRREVIKLRLEGKTLTQIASALGVSLRTVKRDFAKVKLYVKSQQRLRAEREDQRRLERLFGGMSAEQRLLALARLMGDQRRPRRKRGGAVRQVLVVDADAALRGEVAFFSVPPNLSLSTQQPTVEIVLLIQGRILKLGNLTFTQNPV